MPEKANAALAHRPITDLIAPRNTESERERDLETKAGLAPGLSFSKNQPTLETRSWTAASS